MSHTAEVKCEVRDAAAIQAACRRVGAQYLGRKQHKLFSSTNEGHGVKLKDWRFPVVFDGKGNVALDDFHGHWGKVAELDKFKQAYAVEAAKAAARKQGLAVSEQKLADGSIKLVCRST